MSQKTSREKTSAVILADPAVSSAALLRRPHLSGRTHRWETSTFHPCSQVASGISPVSCGR